MICIISGPTCSGKSTLLQSPKLQSITNISASKRVLFPHMIANNDDSLLARDCYFHYNLLRIAHKTSSQTVVSQSNTLSMKFNTNSYTFSNDNPWHYLNMTKTPKKAIVLVATRSTLTSRISSRQYIEPINLDKRTLSHYPSESWLNTLNKINLNTLYLRWFAELSQRSIPYQIVYSDNNDFTILSEKEFNLLDLEQ